MPAKNKEPLSPQFPVLRK